ncbi:MAG: ABC transporter ATP-binding protein [Paracoccus sp. (in: a-proteobacteria)]|nr:ABC transporter ATP-binding protein [Paracoccus sp. (in: a-proteobacteria)]
MLARPRIATDTTRPAIKVEGLTKAFYDADSGRVTVAVSDFSFSVARGEFVCIVGPSGCGKTTVLRILADLEQPLGGSVTLNSDSPPAMVFQEASVLPWLTVSQNIALPLSLKGVARRDRDRRVGELLALTGLSDFAHARPHQLSGGMKQRVSVARALVDDRDILLMDEPFGALDEQTRLVLQQELLRIWETTGKTVVFITHSVDEALTLADRVLVMSPRPGTLIADLSVPFARPRDVVEMRRDKRFWDLTYEVWHLLGSRQQAGA